MDIPKYEIMPTYAKYDPDTIQAVGEFFLESASAETTLLLILNELQAHPHQATINGLQVLVGMANKLMLEKIGVSLLLIAPQHHAELDRICVKIRKIFEHRNAIAHSCGIMGEGARITVTPFKIRTRVRLEQKTYHVKHIREYSENLRQLVRHLSSRITAIGVASTPEFALPAFVDKERPAFPVHPPHEAEPEPPHQP